MKKSLKLLVSFILIIIFTLTLCACDGRKHLNEENCDDNHDLKQLSYTAPTCKTNGQQVLKCSKCDYTETKTLLSIEHDYIEKSKTPSTCSQHGTQVLECSMCHTKTNKELPLLDHNYELISETPSTCVVKGHNNYKCNDCSATKTEELDLSEHNYKIVTENATCFTHGSTKEICEICQDTKLINETPLLTHSFETDGYCSKCGIFETLFDEEQLNIELTKADEINVNLIKIKGKFIPKFKSNNTLLNSYWQNHIVIAKITLFDKNDETIKMQSFESYTLSNGELCLAYGGGGQGANDLFLYFGNYQYFTMTELQQCTSFKLELSCEGYKTIEKTYQLTDK